MSRFEALEQAARELEGVRIPEELWNLARDDRFAAVLAWLKSERETWIRAASAQAMADRPGALTHAAGSLYCLDKTLARIRQIVDTPPAREDRSTPPEDTH